MARIVLPREKVWTQQPQGAARISQKLRGAVSVWLGSQPNIDLKRNASLSIAGGSSIVGAPGRGIALSVAGGNGIVLTTASAALIPSGAQACTIAVWRRSQDTTARSATLFGMDNGASDRVLAHAPYSDGTLYWDFGNANSGSGRVSVSYAKSTAPEVLIFTAGPTRGREVWRNGVRIASGAGATATYSGTSKTFRWGGSANWESADSDEFYLGVIALAEWTPAEIQAWSAGPYGATFARPAARVFMAGVGGTPVGLSTETDTAFALSAVQLTAVGLSTETDTAFALSAVQLKAAGLSTETDTAFALSAVQLTTTGLASEADTAFALSAGASTPVGLATETDTAFALGAVQLKAVGLSTETDSALTLSAARPAGLATETDTALTLTGLQIRGVGLASEASTALALAGLQLRATGLATETDIALARAPVQIRSAGLSTEVDTALALAPNVPGAVGLAVETDIALALAGRQIRAVGMATETDAALALTPIQRMAPGLALEIDASFALSAVQLRAVGLATETDTALALDPASTGGTADPADVWNYVLSNGLTAEETAVQTHAMLTALLASCPADLALVLKLLRNKQVTNPSTGRMTVYDDDGSTVLLEGNLFEDAAGAQPYRGQGAERRERLT